MIFKAVHIAGCIKKLNKYIKPEVYLNVNINNKVCTSFTIFRLSILSIIENYICTHDHQFGFKKQHATDMCIYTVKSVIKYYTRQNSPVYTCFLDASKAFDRISHWTLFKKLIACNTPLLIVRILMF